MSKVKILRNSIKILAKTCNNYLSKEIQEEVVFMGSRNKRSKQELNYMNISQFILWMKKWFLKGNLRRVLLTLYIYLITSLIEATWKNTMNNLSPLNFNEYIQTFVDVVFYINDIIVYYDKLPESMSCIGWIGESRMNKWNECILWMHIDLSKDFMFN